MNTDYKTRAWHIIQALAYAAGFEFVNGRDEFGAEIYTACGSYEQRMEWQARMLTSGNAAMAPSGDERLTIQDPEGYRASNEGFEYEVVFAH